MKKILLQCICSFSLACIGVTGSFAQDTTMSVSSTMGTMPVPPPLFSGNSGFRTWSIGVHGGMLAPFAATGGRNDFSKWVPDLGYGGYIKYQISHGLGIQADFLRGSLKANNDKLWAGAPPVSPYSSFQTNVNWGVSLSGVVTLGNINWSQLHTSIQPYATIGAGGINYSPTVTTSAGASFAYNGGKSITSLYVPVGFGLKANLSRTVNLDLGYTIGFFDGDDLDGYVKAPYESDKFSYAHIGLEFALGSSKKPQLARHNAPAQLAKETRDQDNALRASLAASEARYNARLAELNGVKDDLAKMKVDSDGDGVADYFDKCPNTPSGVKVDGAGCALPTPPPPPVRDTVTRVVNNTYVITEEDKKIVSEAIRNLEFDFGKSTIRARSLPYLDRVAALLVKKGFSLKLAGHTDNVGSDAANLRLSKDRAESVKNYLVSQGANNGKVEATGYGESQPIASNKTDAGRQKNRRVEFTLF